MAVGSSVGETVVVGVVGGAVLVVVVGGVVSVVVVVVIVVVVGALDSAGQAQTRGMTGRSESMQMRGLTRL